MPATGSPSFAAALLVAAAPTVQAQNPEAAPTVLVILAHPDDELVFAPAIAAATRKGSSVTLVFATSGDAGPGVSGIERGAALAERREAEARCSGEALGVAEVRFLRFGDGTLADRARSAGEGARDLLGHIERLLGSARPDVVVTWGPEGGYGHSDHRMIGAFTTQLLQSRSFGERPALLYPALVHAPLPEPLVSQGWATTAKDLSAIRLEYSDADLAASAAAVQCHQTQFDAATRAALVPGFHAAVWKGEVSFREAF